MWAAGIVDLGLTFEQFWSLTPREFGHLRERWQAKQEREDRRAALIACLIANANRDPKRRSRPFDIEDFMPGPRKIRQQSVQEMISFAQMFTAQYEAKERSIGKSYVDYGDPISRG